MENKLVRILLMIIFPPLAVMDKGCGSMLIVFIACLFAWLPGVVVAALICKNDLLGSGDN